MTSINELYDAMFFTSAIFFWVFMAIVGIPIGALVVVAAVVLTTAASLLWLLCLLLPVMAMDVLCGWWRRYTRTGRFSA